MGLVYFERREAGKEGINTEGTEVGAPFEAQGKQRARRHLGHTMSLRNRMETVSPAATSSRSGDITRKQFDLAKAATSPEPCQASGFTSGTDPCHSTRA